MAVWFHVAVWFPLILSDVSCHPKPTAFLYTVSPLGQGPDDAGMEEASLILEFRT